MNSSVVGPTDTTYDSPNVVFGNSNLGNTVASISQSSVRSAHMNATSGNGFSTFNVSLANQPRNSVVGARHIPITKFSRGHTRGREPG